MRKERKMRKGKKQVDWKYPYQLTRFMKLERLKAYEETLSKGDYIIKHKYSKRGFRMRRKKDRSGWHLYAIFTRGKLIERGKKSSEVIRSSYFDLLVPINFKKYEGISLLQKAFNSRRG